MITLTYEINGVKFRRGYSFGMKEFALARAGVLRQEGIEVHIGITGGGKRVPDAEVEWNKPCQ